MPQKTVGDRILQAVLILGHVLLVGIPALSWSKLPMSIPSHFAFSGRPDQLASRAWIFLLPAMGIIFGAGIHLLTTQVAGMDQLKFPVRLTDENRGRQRQLMWRFFAVLTSIVVWTFSYVVWGMVQTAQGNWEGLSPAFLPVQISAILLTIVIYFITAKKAA